MRELIDHKMEDQGKEIFNVQLDKEGAAWILKFCRIIQWVLLFGIISGGISVVHNFIRIATYKPFLFASRPGLKYEYALYPYVWLFFDIIYFIQVFAYWQFRKGMKKAVTNHDSYQFNTSFYHMLAVTRLSVITTFIGLLSQVVSLYLHFKYIA